MAKTTDKGLGWKHQKAVEYLMYRHKDGSPCEWCGHPMWLDPTKNRDYNPDSKRRGNGVLQGDHSKMSRSECLRRGLTIPSPDRLLHGECNRQRGSGMNDHLAYSTRSDTPDTPDNLAMPWPW